jgi:hypothetical protein
MGQKDARDTFDFEGAEKALHAGVVVTIACPSHAEYSQNRIETVEVGAAGLFAALIGMVHADHD